MLLELLLLGLGVLATDVSAARLESVELDAFEVSLEPVVLVLPLSEPEVLAEPLAASEPLVLDVSEEADGDDVGVELLLGYDEDVEGDVLAVELVLGVEDEPSVELLEELGVVEEELGLLELLRLLFEAVSEDDVEAEPLVEPVELADADGLDDEDEDGVEDDDEVWSLELRPLLG